MSDPYVAMIGIQTEIHIDLGAGLVNIPWAKDINMPGISVNFVDATTNSSPNGFTEDIPGLKTAGEPTFTINYHPEEPTHEALWDLLQASELADFHIIMPQFDPTPKYDFSAYVGGHPINSPLGDIVSIDVTLHVQGNIEKSFL